MTRSVDVKMRRHIFKFDVEMSVQWYLKMNKTIDMGIGSLIERSRHHSPSNKEKYPELSAKWVRWVNRQDLTDASSS